MLNAHSSRTTQGKQEPMQKKLTHKTNLGLALAALATLHWGATLSCAQAKDVQNPNPRVESVPMQIIAEHTNTPTTDTNTFGPRVFLPDNPQGQPIQSEPLTYVFDILPENRDGGQLKSIVKEHSYVEGFDTDNGTVTYIKLRNAVSGGRVVVQPINHNRLVRIEYDVATLTLIPSSVGADAKHHIIQTYFPQTHKNAGIVYIPANTTDKTVYNNPEGNFTVIIKNSAYDPDLSASQDTELHDANNKNHNAGPQNPTHH